MHHSLDTLHRFLANLRDPDWLTCNDPYLVALACVFICAKINSTHFGSTSYLLNFYYKERPRSLKPKQELLPDLKDTKMREALELELFKVEFEILRCLNFQFTKLDDLPLTHIRNFMRQLKEHHHQ